MYLIRLPVCVIDCWSSFTDDHLAVLVAGDCFIDTVRLDRMPKSLDKLADAAIAKLRKLPE